MKFPEIGGLGGENFVRLKSGDKVRGIFRGDVYTYRQHWMGGFTVPCPGPQNCEHCKADNRGSFRFRLNFVTKDEQNESEYKVKIFEGGRKLFTSLKSLNEDYELDKTLVIITRTGSTKDDTTYTVVPAPNGTLTEAVLEKLKALPLHDLVVKPKEAEHGPLSDEEVPF